MLIRIIAVKSIFIKKKNNVNICEDNQKRKMRLKFVIDKKFEKNILKDKEMSSLRGYTTEDIKSLDSRYKKNMKYLKLTKEMYQRSWNEINDEFSKFVERITGYGWTYQNYECIVSIVEPGWTKMGGGSNRIIRWWKDNPYFTRRITAHELIESHYFEIYNKYYRNSGLTKGQVWALAEIAAYTLTSLPKEVGSFWPWNTDYMGSYYPNTGYPQLEKIKNRFKQIFLTCKNFDEYIKTGIKLIKQYPKINSLAKR